MPNYNSKWDPNSLNQGFWREVLVGQEIVDVKFNDSGLYSLILSSGEEVFVPRDSTSNLFIKTNIVGGSMHLDAAAERENVTIDVKLPEARVVRGAETITIDVNGEEHRVTLDKKLTHSDITKLSHPGKEGEWIQYLTCVYSSAHCDGSLYNGGPGIWPKPGMRFTCVHTGGA